jgi:hypothetical protein
MSDKKSLILINYLLLLILSSCIEKFVPEIPESDGELVVEGYVSDREETYVVRLTRSRRLDADEPIAETGAAVKILENGNIEHMLVESTGGVYMSKAGNFVGKVGAEYTLDIVTLAGQHYQSSTERMIKTPPIDSVYFEREVRFTDVEDLLVDGIKILVDTHDPTNSTRYYKWEWKEDWEYKASYPNSYGWVPGDRITDPGHPVFNPSPNVFCYNTNSSKQVLIASTNTLEKDVLSRFEIKYVNTLGRELVSLYSILVKQYAISENAYKYWRELKGLSESQGTLFDKQPYALPGNVGNLNDPEEVVLGYFEALSVDEERIFIRREQLKELDFPTNACYYEKVDSVNYWTVQDYLDQGYLIYGVGGFLTAFVHMVPRDCADCTYHGSLEKPDYLP